MASRTQEKIDRLNENLKELNEQVNAAKNFLELLYNHSQKVVEDLEKSHFASLQVFLKEYTKANASLTKYINTVLEVNCNLEIVQFEEGEENYNFNGLRKNQNQSEIIKDNLSESNVFNVKLEKVDEFKSKTEVLNLKRNENLLDVELSLTSPKKVTNDVSSNLKEKNETPNYSDVKNVIPYDLPTATTTNIDELNLNSLKELNWSASEKKMQSALNPSQIPDHSNKVQTFNDFVTQNFLHVNFDKNVNFCEKITELPSKYSNAISLIDLTKSSQPSKESLPYFNSNLSFLVENTTPNWNRKPREIDIFYPNCCDSSITEISNLPADTSEKSAASYVKPLKVPTILNPCANEYVSKNKIEDFSRCSKENTTNTTQVNELYENQTYETNNVSNGKVISNRIYELRNMHLKLDPGTEYEGFVEHIVTPGELFVHFCIEDIKQISLMEKKLEVLSEELKSTTKNKDKYQAMNNLGEVALCFFDGKLWRVMITDWRSSNDDEPVSVFFVDFGDTKDVPLSCLHPMPDSIRKYPKFAQKCHLAGIYPRDCESGKPMKPWSKESGELLEVLLEGAFKFRIVISENDGCYEPDSVPIIIHTEDSAESINKGLLDYDYAISLKKPPLQKLTIGPLKPREVKQESSLIEIEPKKFVEADEFSEFDPMKEHYYADDNNYDLDMDDPSAAITGYVPKDYERVCHVFARTGQCFKGYSCRKEHFRLDPSGYTTDQEEIYTTTFDFLKSPEVNEIFRIQVTVVKHINRFCCILQSDRDHKDQETLSTLVRYMNSPENIRELGKLGIPPAVGQIVIGKFGDELWYRARVIDVLPEVSRCTLLFVDYGHKKEVPFTDVRKIQPQYLHLPFQAINCKISNIVPAQNVPRSKAISHFLDEIEGKNDLKIKVISVMPGEDLNLIVKLYVDSKDVGESFLNDGYAEYQKDLLFDKKCVMYPG